MVTVNQFEKQYQLETEVETLKDTLVRLTQRVLLLENFIKAKHGQSVLDELPLLVSSDLHNEFMDMFFTTPEISHTSTATTTINGTTTTTQSSFETETREFVITVPSTTTLSETTNQKIEICSNLTHEEGDEEEHSVSDDNDDNDFDEANPSEIVPDAIREETITENGANIDIINVYQGDIPEDMNFSSTSNTEYTHVVTYDVIPTNIVFNEKQQEQELQQQQEQTGEISITLPPTKTPASIRIYKPELKRFTTVPGAIEMTAIRYHCEECSRDFNNIHNLNLHKAKHERLRVKKKVEAEKKLSLRIKGKIEFQFKCSYCDLRYPTDSKRKLHEKTHTSVKKFMCDECGLSFNSKAGLCDHKVGHSGIRNHVCHLCPASFLRSRNCLKHIRFVHGLVQIKTVVDGKRVIEFVTPEQAPSLIEERKDNQESKESINARRVQRRKLLQQAQPQQDANNKSTVRKNSVKRKSPKVAQKSKISKKQKKEPEQDSNSEDIDISEDDLIDSDILQHIKLEPEEDDDENMSSS